jgi:hypothetical protein
MGQQYKKRNKVVQGVWKVMVVFICISMVLAFILPFVDLGI